MPGFGRNTHVGWVQETTWGTPVTPPTKYAEIVSADPALIYERAPRQVLRGLDPVEGNLYDVKQGAEPVVVVEAFYEGMLRLLEHLFGDASGTTAVQEASVRWGHTFVPKATIMTGKGLTLYVNTDVDDGGNEEVQVAGVKINACTFSGAPGRALQMSLACVGKASVDVANNAPTFPTRSLLVAGHQLSCEIDDVVRKIDSFELEFNNGLNIDKRVMGSKNIDEPVRGDDNPPRVIQGTLVMDALLADLTKLRSGTFFKLELLNTGPTLGNLTYGLDITMTKCLVTGPPFNVSTAGVIKSNLPFRAHLPSAGGDAITLLMRNGESAIA